MKKEKQLVFNGLGFPITLMSPQYKEVRGETVLDIDYDRLQLTAFEGLLHKPTSFSGAELKFIRHHMEMTQNTFADFLGVDRSVVGKWEAADLEWTRMNIATETMVRIRMVQFLDRSIDKEMAAIEPGARKQDVGQPIEVVAKMA